MIQRPWTHTASSTGGYTGVSGNVAVTVDDTNTASVVTISGGAAIEEGGNAVFTLTATPPPASA